MIIPTRRKSGYSPEQEATWERAFQLEVRTTPDDGQPLAITDWIDFTFLNRLFFSNPPTHNPSALWEWRMHARTPLQRMAASRLVRHGLLTMLDAEQSFVRLSANGYRKIGRVWQYMADFVVQSDTLVMHRAEQIATKG